MRPVPERQRRQAHRQRRAFARALHQLRGVKRQWLSAWTRYGRHAGPRPMRISLPRLVRHHKVRLYRALMGA